MIKKFEEWINEGLWSKGVERSHTGEERLGDKLPDLFKADDVLQIKGYPEYYMSPRGKYGDIVVYHAPNETPICEYENLYFPDDEPFQKGMEYWEDYELTDDVSDEDAELMCDDDFIEAIYHTIEDAEE